MIRRFEGKNTAKVSQQIFKILSEVYSVSPWNAEQITAELTKPDNVTYLAFDGSELVGFLMATSLIEDYDLINLAVSADKQGRGIGSQLLGTLTAFNLPIFLEVRASNLCAQHLYEKFGFFKYYTRKAYYNVPTEDALLMKREKDDNTFSY